VVALDLPFPHTGTPIAMQELSQFEWSFKSLLQ